MSYNTFLALRKFRNIYSIFASILDLIMGLLSVVVFVQIIRNKKPKSNMFHFFLAQAISDCFFGAIYVVYYILWLGRNLIESLYFAYFSFSGQVFNIYIHEFVGNILLSLVAFNQAWATIDCYFSIIDKFKGLRSKCAFYLISVITLVYSVMSQVYVAFQFFIYSETKISSNNVTFSFYTTFYSEIANSHEIILPENIDYFGRFGVTLVVILVVNLLILKVMKTSARKKQVMGGGRQDNNQISLEKKRVIMILLTGLNFFMGQFLYVIYKLKIAFFPTQSETEKTIWVTVGDFGWTLLHTSNFTCFILYYLFNKHYKEYIDKNLRLIFYPAFLLITKLSNRKASSHVEF